jgi:hypothetical protein
MSKGKNFLVGVFDEEEVLMEAIPKIRKEGVKIHEVYTPYPVHGLDEVLGYSPSNLPIGSFIFGLTGTICALTMMIGMLGLDWPMDIGGKPYIPLPAFIPITFEVTVLFAAHGMALAFLIVANLKPWGVNKVVIFDKRSSDNKFVMAIDLDKNHSMDNSKLSGILKNTGAAEISTKTLA